MARKSFAGAAPATTLSAPISNSVTNIPVVATTAAWPNTATGPFVITINRGSTTSEEKVLCASYTSTNIVATTRGYDGTTAQSHNTGDTVNCTIDANTIDTHDAVIAGVGTSTPSTSAVGDSAVLGTALTTPAAGDHKHARESFATTTTTSAVGDTKNDGTSASPARADHKHAREAFGTPGNSNPGDAAANGTATTISRSDHVHGRVLPAGRIYQTVQTVAANATFTQQTLGGTDYLRGGVTVGTNSLVVPIAGIYRVNGNVAWGAFTASTALITAIYLNGTIARRRDGGTAATGSGFPSVTCDDTMVLAANDIITLYGWQASSAPLGSQAGTAGVCLSLELVST